MKKNRLLTWLSVGGVVLLAVLLVVFFATRNTVDFITDYDYLYDAAVQYLLEQKENHEEGKKDYQTFIDYEGFEIAEDREYRYAYMWIYDKSFYVDENNQIRLDASASMPYKFYFEKGTNEVIKYENPQDGDDYAASVKRMFPNSVAKVILNFDSFDDAEIEAQRREHYNYLDDTEVHY